MTNLENAKSYIDGLELPEQFGMNLDCEDDRYIEDIYYFFSKKSAEVFHGASKIAVILPQEDYVLKIGFNGVYCSTDTYNEETGDWECSDEDDWIEYSESGSFGGNDYCLTEQIIYDKAVAEGLEGFFAETCFVDEVDGHRVFAQEKVIPDNDCMPTSHKTPSDESFHYIKSKRAEDKWYRPSCSDEWDAAAIDCYGMVKYLQFLEFCKENDIKDLYGANYGWRADGTPVLLDFSNYREEW